MNRVSGKASLVAVLLWICHSVLVESVQADAERMSKSVDSFLPSNAEYKFEIDNVKSEDSFLEENGGSSSSSVEAREKERENWLQGVDNFSTRLFKLEEENQSWPMLKFGWRTVSGVILGCFGAALSSAGGIGGGGLFVPLFNLLLQFDAKTSAALSNFMVLGGSLTNLYVNLRQHHPSLPHKPLIDYDVVLIFQPNLLLGISTGVILNVILPDWTITALLTLALIYMSVYSYKGGLIRWRKENKQNYLRKSAVAKVDGSLESPSLQAANDFCLGTDEEDVVEKVKAYISGSRFSQHRIPVDGTETTSVFEPLLHFEKSFGSSLFPTEKLLALGFTWVAFFAIQVLRGGKNGQGLLGISAKCGWEYWLLTFTQIPLAVGVTAWTICRFRATHPIKEDPKSIQEDGFMLRPEYCRRLAWMAFLAGMSGGLLGVGGGMIVNPMLLSIGMLPQVISGTCASMVFFSSSMSVVQFSLMGRVPVGYALSGALISSVGSFVGVTFVNRAITKHNRASIIIFSVATVMGLSALLMAGFGGFGIWEKFVSGAYMGFHYPC